MFPQSRKKSWQTGFVGLLCGGNGPPILKGLRVSDWRTKFDVHLHCHSAQLPLLATSVGAGVGMPWQCHEGKGGSGWMCTNMAKTSYWGDSISRQDFSVFNLFFHLSYFFLIHLMSWIWTFFHFEFLVSQLYSPMSWREEILYYGKNLEPEAKIYDLKFLLYH